MGVERVSVKKSEQIKRVASLEFGEQIERMWRALHVQSVAYYSQVLGMHIGKEVEKRGGEARGRLPGGGGGGG